MNNKNYKEIAMFVLLFLLSLTTAAHAAQSAQAKEYVVQRDFKLIENSLLYMTTSVHHHPTQSMAHEDQAFVKALEGNDVVWKFEGAEYFNKINPPLSLKQFSKSFIAAKKMLDTHRFPLPYEKKIPATQLLELTQSELESAQ